MKDYLDLVIFVNQNITYVLNDVSEDYILDNVKKQYNIINMINYLDKY